MPPTCSRGIGDHGLHQDDVRPDICDLLARKVRRPSRDVPYDSPGYLVSMTSPDGSSKQTSGDRALLVAGDVKTFLSTILSL